MVSPNANNKKLNARILLITKGLRLSVEEICWYRLRHLKRRVALSKLEYLNIGIFQFGYFGELT